MTARTRQLNTYERLLENFAKSRAGGFYFVQIAGRIDPFLLRTSNGRFSLSIGQPILLLTTIGAKSGKPRETALLFMKDGDRIVLVASRAGSTKHPAWYHNLKANPEVDVIAPGRRSGHYVAREAEGDERERLWALANDYYAGYETYQGRTAGRRIPVIVLERS